MLYVHFLLSHVSLEGVVPIILTLRKGIGGLEGGTAMVTELGNGTVET